MSHLKSAHVVETIRGSADAAPQVTDYLFEAPNRMRLDVNDGAAKVVIGEQGYRRNPSSTTWTPERWPSPFAWPSQFYDSFWSGATAVRAVAADAVDGTPTTVLAFVRPDLPAWFRLWVDATGRVQRLEMLTDGHLMDQHFDRFDAAAPVTAPG